MKILRVGLLIGLSWAGAVGFPVKAQEGPTSEQVATTLDEIVVVARRSGAPIWNAQGSRGEIILVGYSSNLSAEGWNSEQLVAAAARADIVFVTEQLRLGAMDVLKLKQIRLPRGERLDDILPADTVVILQGLEASSALSQEWRTQHPIKIAEAIRSRVLDGPRGQDALSVILESAREARLTVQEISPVPDREAMNRLALAAVAGFDQCLKDASTAYGEGRDVDPARTRAWLRHDIPTVLSSPLDRSYQSCGLMGPQGYGPVYREAWRAALNERLQLDGVVLAVVPLEYLAEDAGLLDGLAAQGIELSGPAWR